MFLAYTSQYEARHFSTAANRRRRNADTAKKIAPLRTLPKEQGALKLFNAKLLQAEKLLILSELDHRTLHICAHTNDKNLRAQQLTQLWSVHIDFSDTHRFRGLLFR